MPPNSRNSHWLGRIIGGLVVAAVAFALLSIFDTWGLGLAVRLVISLVLGAIFTLFGGRAWRFIVEILNYS